MKTYELFLEMNPADRKKAQEILADMQANKGRQNLKLSQSKPKPPTTQQKTSDWAKKQADNKPKSTEELIADKKERDAEQKVIDAKANAKDAKKEREQKTADAIEKRRTQGRGVVGGIKSAMGGDVAGMRIKKDDSDKTKEAIEKRNRAAKYDFAKKKTQQAGNFVKDTLTKPPTGPRTGVEATGSGGQGRSGQTKSY